MSVKRFKVQKLIRDEIPRILRDKGIVVHDKILEKEEFIQSLKDKLLEEGEEVRQTQNAEELLEELADILEIIQTLTSVTGFSMEEVEKKRIAKRNKKGGFEKKIYNYHIDIEENNKVIDYYLNKPTRYPQMNQTHKSGCVFCQMASGEKEVPLFAQFQHCFVIKDQFPVSPGHILIIPYEHTENWFTANEDVRKDIVKALSLVKEKLDYNYSPQGYNIGANCGEVAGQTVMHLHVHLIPRYKGDMQDPKTRIATLEWRRFEFFSSRSSQK